MEIKWYGQSCFEIKTKQGVIVTDPFVSDYTGLKLPKLKANIITVSHQHQDHNNTGAVSGIGEVNPVILDAPGEFEIAGISIVGVSSFHDEKKGAERGLNNIFLISAEDLRICHLGDLGESLNPEQVEILDGVDILLVPVGGTYTIDAEKACEVTNQLEPSIVIPMHYSIPGLKFKLDSVDKFLKEIGVDANKIENSFKIQKSNLPEEMEVVVFGK